MICHELARVTRKYCFNNLPKASEEGGFNFPWNPETVPDFRIILPRNSQIYAISVCIVPGINFTPYSDLRSDIYRNNIDLDTIDWIVYETTMIDYNGDIIDNFYGDDRTKKFLSISELLEEIVNVKNKVIDK